MGIGNDSVYVKTRTFDPFPPGSREVFTNNWMQKSPPPAAGPLICRPKKSSPTSSRSTMNAQRKKKQGHIRWLRPDYQISRFAPKPK